MTKTDFLEILASSLDNFNCIGVIDATIRYNFNYVSIVISWKNTSYRTVVKTLKGRETDLKVQEELTKYKTWADSLSPNQ